MKNFKKYAILLLLIFIFAITLSGFKTYAATSSNMKVNYIDVGESDCVLIQSSGKNMLVDAGDSGDGDKIISYLKKQKVKKLDFIICTHPHEDHIGGMSDVINSFSVGKIIMPDKTHVTQTFEDLLNTIKNRNLKITLPKVGTKYAIGKANFTILAPNNYKYGDNLNNYSVSIKLTNGKNSFIFLGDCETEAIEDILNNKINIKANVLMLGHHGSDTSTTIKLLKAVSPSSAIISVGKNSYGHPGESVLQMLGDRNIKTYRTDESGTIIATSTGSKISFNVNASKTETSNSTTTDSQTVYITKTGTKYHLANCPSLSNSKIKTTLKEAKAKGLEPCSKCNPPK